MVNCALVKNVGIHTLTTGELHDLIGWVFTFFKRLYELENLLTIDGNLIWNYNGFQRVITSHIYHHQLSYLSREEDRIDL